MNEFVWTLHELGYRFYDPGEAAAMFGARSEDGPWIGPADLSKTGGKTWRRYAPLRDNFALYLNLADVDDRPDSILNFANRFGLLTDPAKGEPLAIWKSAIKDMRSAVGSCEATLVQVPHHGVAKRDRGSFSSTTRTDPEVNELARIFLSASSTDIGVRISHPDRDHDNALFELGYLIARNISHVRLGFNYDELLDGFKFRPMPGNLLEAMWLQLGQALESNKVLRKCRQCGMWFEVSAKSARADKVFCTEACKAKAYRERLKQTAHRALENNEGQLSLRTTSKGRVEPTDATEGTRSSGPHTEAWRSCENLVLLEGAGLSLGKSGRPVDNSRRPSRAKTDREESDTHGRS